MRIKRLDGLRAVAILLIILAANNIIDLGWTGVELSFVLTGFLTTRILRDSRTNESYWSRFFFKRAVRVVPLILIVLLVNKLASRNLSLIGVAGYGLFLGNVMNLTRYAWSSVGMLGSIAIAAQFLLLWSIAVRFLGRRTLMTIAIVVLVAEPVVRHFYTPYSPDYAPGFNLLPFRMDSLMAGSLLALLAENVEALRRIARWSGWAALALVSVFLLVSYQFYPWYVRMTNTVAYNTTSYSTLTAIYFFVVLWVLFLREGQFAERVLSSPPLLFIEKLSYGMFLFHPLVYVTLKKLFHLPFGTPGEHGNRQIFPIAVLLSSSIGFVLYRFIQLPIKAWGDPRAQRLQVEHGDPPRTEQDAIAIEG